MNLALPKRLLSSEATKMINFFLFVLPMFLMYPQIFWNISMT